ncbi:MAG TPA: carboxypeptidase regulatory-like domain-containing protein [Candidatus Binatia bacterium]|nr:carboxypeptidase regulatory-like domain-containing protein [Candidatus Binatia bacterium]
MMQWTSRWTTLALGVLVLGGTALAADDGRLAGRVVDGDGRPVVGALVTARHLALARETTVYADAEGRWVFSSLASGAHHIRVRRPGFRDRVEGVAVDGAGHELVIPVERETDPRELAWQLPANRWLALAVAHLPDDEAREEFLRQCTYCHQQGSWATRVQRDPEQWRKLLALMARMGGILSTRTRTALPGALNAAYDEASYVPALGERFVAPPPPAPAAAHAVVTEWEVGGVGSMQHDITVHPDGRVYSVDTMQDKVYRLDPRTGERRTFDIPRGDSPLGGVFASQQPIPANADSHVAPHSLQVAPDGSIWITLCLGNKIARFDPVRERFDVYLQEEGLYPHTIRFDARGRAWYTLAVSNQVAMLDPATGARRTYRLPARTWGETVAVRAVPWVLWLGRWVQLDPEAGGDAPTLPVPYGIDVAPDGGIWFSQLNARRIGRLDPETGDIRMVDTPFTAPRRLRFDSHGRLWIPGFSSSVLARFDPGTGEFRTWDLPIEPRGTETPYALNVDRRTDTVWICGTQSDTLIRFEPARERFTVYPLPTRVTYTREIEFDADGAVWTSNSNLPAWQIEGAVPKLIRLEPDGPRTTRLATR